MPVGRYFLFVGSALVALLLLVDWMWSSPTGAPVQQAYAETAAPAKDVGLRIHSGQKWPEKVVFDTAVPPIVSPKPPVDIAESAPVAKQAVPEQTVTPPLDARAEMKTVGQQASLPKRLARHHHRAPQRAPTWVAANPPGWGSWNW